MSGGTAPPAALVAVVQDGRVALAVGDDGVPRLPALPGWDGRAWRYGAAVADAEAAGRALPPALTAPLTHLAPLDFGGDDRPPVALAEPRGSAVAAEAWWEPGEPFPAGLSEPAARALVAALAGEGEGPAWPGEPGVRLGLEVAPVYHALSYLAIGAFLPRTLAAAFGGNVARFVERQLEASGL